MAQSSSKGLSKDLSTLLHRFKLVLANRNTILVLHPSPPIRSSLHRLNKRFEKRYERHCNGSGGSSTYLDPPESLVYSEKHESFSDARKREAQVKRWNRAKKEALEAGDMDKLRSLSLSNKN